MTNSEKNTTTPSFRIKTDFEKLLFANAYIKQLKEQIRQLELEKGYLYLEIEEMRSQMKADNPDLIKLLSYKEQLANIMKKKNKYKLRWEVAENRIHLLSLKLHELTKL